MKVSIITVSFNSEKTIEDTIKSVLAQDYKNIEYIVIDGGSLDGTKKVVDSYKSEISYFISESDSGIYDAMNKGIKASTGNLIGILNSDDVYANSSVISNMVNSLGESDAVYADLVYVDADNLDKVKRVWKSGNYKKGLFSYGWMPPHPTFFVKKDCYNRFGLYSTMLSSAADYELMLRFIHKNNIEVSYHPSIIVKMRLGGVSNTSLKNRLRANREDKKAWRMNDSKPKFFTFILKPLRKLNQFRI